MYNTNTAQNHHTSITSPSQNHVTCVSEHEKYALGATKPGGFAEKGFYHDGAAPAQNSKQQGPTGMEHLTTRCESCMVAWTIILVYIFFFFFFGGHWLTCMIRRCIVWPASS